ncbi:sugar ABC transporter ATP-binding protein, partial [Candidatus Sumerlaeota bacterium]|nr:sugar ABC transporter ATP-binding protein [Candidatus Sumerlaeota bacterium]
MTKFIPILVMRGVRKMFGTTVALDHVDLDVGAGEVHAVIGENGAGKSTLMKILCGVIPPDEGEIQLGGEPYRPRGPHHAMRNGLAMIHQELNLAPHLTAEANILLGMENSRAGFLRAGVNLPRARATLDQLRRPDIPLDLPVRQLGIGEQQIIEIARALAVNARIIVMDEPTSSLSGEDRLHLFQVIRRLKERGISVIYISHFLEEVREICDRFTVLRDGKTVGTGEVASTPQSELIRMMVGRKIEDIFPPRDRTPGEPVLSVGKLRGTKLPREASLQLYRGEILGLAGLVGAGRTETLRAIFGLDPIVSGSARLAAATAG